MLEPEQVRELDGGRVNLELTLFGEKMNAERPFLNAGTIIEIDPDEWADGWVRVTVPLESLDATCPSRERMLRTDRREK